MAYARVFTEQYSRRAARFLKRHPELRPHYLKTLQLLEANPFHPSLRLHPYTANWKVFIRFLSICLTGLHWNC